MKYCTECASTTPSSVIDSRPSKLPKSGKPSIRRERKCQCGHKWFTYEITEKDLSELLQRANPAAPALRVPKRVAGGRHA